MFKKLKITVEGRPYNVTVEDVTEGASTVAASAPAAAPVAAAAPAPAAAAPAAAPAAPKAGAGDEVAPLGGVMVSINVAVGQAVTAGAVIAVIEAMKMKTEVFAERAGTVGKVYVRPGDPVETGQPILSIS